MAPSSSSSHGYVKDEKVLCFHHELLYEAKVLDSKLKDPNDKKDGNMYRVHYKGWKNTYVFSDFSYFPCSCGVGRTWIPTVSRTPYIPSSGT